MRTIKGALYRSAPSESLVHLPDFDGFFMRHARTWNRTKVHGAQGVYKTPPECTFLALLRPLIFQAAEGALSRCTPSGGER